MWVETGLGAPGSKGWDGSINPDGTFWEGSDFEPPPVTVAFQKLHIHVHLHAPMYAGANT